MNQTIINFVEAGIVLFLVFPFLIGTAQLARLSVKIYIKAFVSFYSDFFIKATAPMTDFAKGK